MLPLYHQQQNKWYLQRWLLSYFEATLYFSRTELRILTHKLLWASKFATAKIECCLKMGK